MPPAVYIAGADHLPLKFSPVRQLMGPRPPLPPTMKPPFFRLGITTTQSAFASTSSGTEPPLSIAVSTLVPLEIVSSSFVLSAPQAGRIDSRIRTIMTTQAGVHR